jgi:hypothetical protein
VAGEHDFVARSTGIARVDRGSARVVARMENRTGEVAAGIDGLYAQANR